VASVADILALAQQQLGKTYVFGAAGPNTFDCSGLVTYVFGKQGINLPHHAADQATYGTAVNPNAIQAGDLVFSDWGDGANSHVGIATSSSQIIDAPHTGAVVRYDNLGPSYRQHITAVRRVLDGGAGGNVPVVGGPIPPGTDTGGSGLLPDVSGLVQPFKDIATAAGDVASIGDKAVSLFAPSNFMRIVAGLAGVLFILIGIWFLSREIRDDGKGDDK
jgi:hypothetical protein